MQVKTDVDIMEWLNNVPIYGNVLKEMKELDEMDLDNDVEFVTSFQKGLITERFLIEMEKQQISKFQLSVKAKIPYQRVLRFFREESSFKLSEIVEVALALGLSINVKNIFD